MQTITAIDSRNNLHRIGLGLLDSLAIPQDPHPQMFSPQFSER